MKVTRDEYLYFVKHGRWPNKSVKEPSQPTKGDVVAVFDIVPMGKPRMVASDRYKKRPAVQRYWKYKDMLKLQAEEQGYVPGESISLRFYLPIPKTLNKKRLKKAEREALDGQPCRSKPDLDNLIKAFKDALMDEDSQVWRYGSMEKFFSKKPRIEVVKMQ